MSLHYYLPAEIKETNKIKFVHMECCSDEEIKIIFSCRQKIKSGCITMSWMWSENTTIVKIKDLEMKYDI